MARTRHRSTQSGSRQTLLNQLETRFIDYSRDELYRFVMCGEVRVNGATERDPRVRVPRDANIVLVSVPFVSRGGEKLSAALSSFAIEARGRVWLDAGASTGGFTDCLLQRGALHVHAVDVGYNQLDYRLRSDERVHVRERTNIRDLSTADLDPRPTAAVCDLSFRSLRGIMRHILCLTREGWGIALLKPQFEVAADVRWGSDEGNAGDELDAKAGVLDGAARDAVVERVVGELARDEGIVVHRMMESPVAGRSGNREVLLLVGLSDERRW